MGLRFHKRINLGMGFRINISKSGIGYSWGGPGYRVSHMPNGRVRKTYSIPGTGISYVEENKKNSYPNSLDYNPDTKLITSSPICYNNKNLSSMDSSDLILKKIKRNKKINTFANILLCTYYLTLLGILIKILLLTILKIDLNYEFDESGKEKYQAFNSVMNDLYSNDKLWQINSSSHVFNVKYNAGAGNSVERTPINIKIGTPFYIKTNVDVYCLKLKKQKIYFAPDRIIVFKNSEVGSKKYSGLKMNFSNTSFVEEDRVPRDSQIVRYTWKYVNKNGGPDKRFKNNVQYPVCKYGEMHIQSSDGINTLVEYSNANLTEKLISKFNTFANKNEKVIEKII